MSLHFQFNTFYNMKKNILLLLTLIAFGQIALAQTWTNVHTYEEFITYYNNGTTRLRLTDDITLPSYWVVNRGGIVGLDLNGHTLQRTLWAKLEPCQHLGATYIDNDNGVAFNGQCPHCMMPQGTINFIPYTFQTDGNYNNPDCWFQGFKPRDSF